MKSPAIWENTQHNRLYALRNLSVEGGKLLFMEENQAVVFWGMDLKNLISRDSEVFQAANADDLVWYSEELNFSDWILKCGNGSSEWVQKPEMGIHK